MTCNGPRLASLRCCQLSLALWLALLGLARDMNGGESWMRGLLASCARSGACLRVRTRTSKMSCAQACWLTPDLSNIAALHATLLHPGMQPAFCRIFSIACFSPSSNSSPSSSTPNSIVAFAGLRIYHAAHLQIHFLACMLPQFITPCSKVEFCCSHHLQVIGSRMRRTNKCDASLEECEPFLVPRDPSLVRYRSNTWTCPRSFRPVYEGGQAQLMGATGGTICTAIRSDQAARKIWMRGCDCLWKKEVFSVCILN